LKPETYIKQCSGLVVDVCLLREIKNASEKKQRWIAALDFLREQR
jgi:hypothetical protein